MMVLQQISDGRSVSACAARIAARDRRHRHGRRRVGHVPAISLEALGGVVGEPALHFAVDGDAVVVVERDQLAELQRAGERAGLVRDAFHQAAVAAEHVGVVIDDRRSGRLNCVASMRSASAKPTALAIP